MIEIPKTYAEARPRLALVLRRRFTPSKLAMAARRGPPWFSVLAGSFPWLDAHLVLDDPIALCFVQQRHLSLWDVDPDTALREARRDLEPSAGILSLTSGFAAVPCRDVLLHGDDVGSLLAEARTFYDDAFEPLSPLVYRLTPRGPVPVPAEGPHARALRTAEFLALLQAYDDQAEVLEAELDEGVALPGLTVGELRGELVRVARWDPAQPAYLPEVDLVRAGGRLIPFGELALQRMPGLDPPRFYAPPRSS